MITSNSTIDEIVNEVAACSEFVHVCYGKPGKYWYADVSCYSVIGDLDEHSGICHPHHSIFDPDREAIYAELGIDRRSELRTREPHHIFSVRKKFEEELMKPAGIALNKARAREYELNKERCRLNEAYETMKGKGIQGLFNKFWNKKELERLKREISQKEEEVRIAGEQRLKKNNEVDNLFRENRYPACYRSFYEKPVIDPTANEVWTHEEMIENRDKPNGCNSPIGIPEGNFKAKVYGKSIGDSYVFSMYYADNSPADDGSFDCRSGNFVAYALLIPKRRIKEIVPVIATTPAILIEAFRKVFPGIDCSNGTLKIKDGKENIQFKDLPV